MIMDEYYRILISATSLEEAEMLVDMLLKEKLIAGGFIFEGTSHHWWKGKIDKEKYFNISAYTIPKNRDKIIEITRNNSKDETPGIVFFKIDYANKDFLNWIDKNSK